MRTLFTYASALALTTAMAAWAVPAAADEPFELSPTQLDAVHGGRHLPTPTFEIEGRDFELVVNTSGGVNQVNLTFPETPEAAQENPRAGLANVVLQLQPD